MKTVFSEEKDQQYLQGFCLIKIDEHLYRYGNSNPNIDSAENTGYKKVLDKLFKMKNYVNSREALETALKAVQDIPILVISCGGKYEEIIENSSQVIMIAKLWGLLLWIQVSYKFQKMLSLFFELVYSL